MRQKSATHKTRRKRVTEKKKKERKKEKEEYVSKGEKEHTFSFEVQKCTKAMKNKQTNKQSQTSIRGTHKKQQTNTRSSHQKKRKSSSTGGKKNEENQRTKLVDGQALTRSTQKGTKCFDAAVMKKKKSTHTHAPRERRRESRSRQSTFFFVVMRRCKMHRRIPSVHLPSPTRLLENRSICIYI